MARKSRRNLPDAKCTGQAVMVRAYIRLSRETGDTVERDTVGNQKMLVESFIENRDDLSLYDSYVDDSVSGTTFVRPAFDRMLSDMRSGRIQAIVVKDMSRLGRDYIEAGKLVEHVFPLYGIRLISITDGYDTQKDPNALMMAVTNLTNAMYAQDISRKINAVKEGMIARGVPIGRVPYGYRMNKDNPKEPFMEVDDAAADIVRRIFREFLSGTGTTGLARKLNDEGVPTPLAYRLMKCGQAEKAADYRWTANAVQQILCNETYTGRYVMARTRQRISRQRQREYLPEEEWQVFENHHTAIISKEDFESAKGKKQKKSQRRKNPPNVLKNKIFCGRCGAHMGIPDSAAKTPKYMCRTNWYYGSGCASGYVPKDVVCCAVFLSVKDMIRTFMDEKRVIERYKLSAKQPDRDRDRYEKQLEQCRNKLRILEEKKIQLYGDFCGGLLEEDEYLSINKGYTSKMEGISDMAEQIRRKMGRLKKRETAAASIRERLAAFKGKRKLSQDMADALIEKVIVYSQDRIEVVFRFDDELKLLSDDGGQMEGGA